MQQLGDVSQVGQLALAADAAQHPVRQSRHRERLEDRRDALPGVDVGECPQPPGELVVEGITTLVELRGRVPEQRGERGRPRQRAPVWCGHGLQQREPVVRGPADQHVRPAGGHRVDADLAQRRLHLQQPGVGVRDDRDVAGQQGPSRLAALTIASLRERRPRGQQLRDVAREVGCDVLADRPDPHRPAHVLLADHAQPHRLRVRGAAQPGAGQVRLDRPHLNRRVAELGTAQHDVEAAHERLVAAVVAGERAAVVGGGGRGEVGDDVAAAEQVDRLLGVADEHHRGVPGERAVEHLPLHGVGVLELVDEHDLPARPHPCPRRRVLRCEGAGQLGEQVVVVHDAQPALAHVEFCAHRLREPGPPVGGGAGFRGGRTDRRVQVVDGVAGDLQGDRAGERRLGLRGEPREVEVVDDLDEQVVEILDEFGVGVGVAGHPEATQHLLAELMGGGDRRRVDVGQRRAHAP